MSFSWFSREEYDRIAEMHDHPVLLPKEHLLGTVFPAIGGVAVALTVLFEVYHVLVCIYGTHLDSSRARRKASYQLTNCTANLCLGLLGMYHFVYSLPENPTVEDQVLGLENLYTVSALQFGFQLWAIPAGLLVKESLPMLLHHISVVVVCSTPAFFSLGFRYWTPFFFGVIEISSVPLALMNTFKDHPKWIETYPGLYTCIRLVFAISFLTIRWFMYFPRKYVYLRQNMIALLTADSKLAIWFLSAQWAAAFVVGILQAYWGCLIVKGLVKLVMPSSKTKRPHAAVMNGHRSASMPATEDEVKKD